MQLQQFTNTDMRTKCQYGKFVIFFVYLRNDSKKTFIINQCQEGISNSDIAGDRATYTGVEPEFFWREVQELKH